MPFSLTPSRRISFGSQGEEFLELLASLEIFLRKLKGDFGVLAAELVLDESAHDDLGLNEENEIESRGRIDLPDGIPCTVKE
jgi:hypothetical protein